jgi:hypothetical protein
LEKAAVKANASTKDEMFIRPGSEKERLKVDSRVNAALMGASREISVVAESL